MGIEGVIIAFLRKESANKNNVKSTGTKLMFNGTCIGQWNNHRVVMNDSKYDGRTMKVQEALFKWLKQSDLIFNTVSDIPVGTQDILF